MDYLKSAKLKIVMLRHPLWLIESWHDGDWTERFGKDPREFQLTCRVNGRVVPWFAVPWAKEYDRLKSLDRSIQIVARFIEQFETRRRRLTLSDQKKVAWVPFERFVSEPKAYLNGFAKQLGTPPSGLTRKIFSSLGLPRSGVWGELERKKIEFELRAKSQKVTTESRRLVERLSRDYKRSYLHP